MYALLYQVTLDISSWLQRSAQDIPCTGRRLSAWATMRCCPSMRSLKSWAPNSQRLMLRFCPFSSMKPILENIPSIQRDGPKNYLQGLMDLHRVILHVLGFWRHGEEYSHRMSRAPSPVAIDPRVALNCSWSWRGEGTWARETSDLYCSCCGFWHGMMSCHLSHKRKEGQVSIDFKTTSSKPVMFMVRYWCVTCAVSVSRAREDRLPRGGYQTGHTNQLKHRYAILWKHTRSPVESRYAEIVDKSSAHSFIKVFFCLFKILSLFFSLFGSIV